MSLTLPRIGRTRKSTSFSRELNCKASNKKASKDFSFMHRPLKKETSEEEGTKENQRGLHLRQMQNLLVFEPLLVMQDLTLTSEERSPPSAGEKKEQKKEQLDRQKDNNNPQLLMESEKQK